MVFCVNNTVVYGNFTHWVTYFISYILLLCWTVQFKLQSRVELLRKVGILALNTHTHMIVFMNIALEIVTENNMLVSYS